MKLSASLTPSIELRDPVHGPIRVSSAELRVIDSPVFQRLRGVKQLGFAEYVFPGAVHNRYLHSIGAMHLAGSAFDAVAQAQAWAPSLDLARLRQAIRLAGLLHDIGHAPLSHAAESLMPEKTALGLERYGVEGGQASHEDMTLKLLVDSALAETIADAFRPLGVTAETVAALFGVKTDAPADALWLEGRDAQPLLKAMVAGELDVDRMDYLLRDSYFTGVRYGQYDIAWLLSNLLAVDDDGAWRLGIEARALPAFEHFLLARYHMFQMVYFHPKSDIYDAMLKRWLRSVGPEGRLPADPELFVHCDDPWLLRRLRESADPWAVRIRQRDSLKLVAELRDEAADDQRAAIDAELNAAGLEPLWLAAEPVLSRYAKAPVHLRTNPLYVRDQPGDRLARIEDVTDLFGRYERTRRIARLYVKGAERGAATRIVERALAES